MNRTTALTAAGLLLVALPLAACTSSKPAEPAQHRQQDSPQAARAAAPTALASSIAAPAKASKNYNLQFIQGVAGDEFYITMQCGIQAEAAEAWRLSQDPRSAEVRPHAAKSRFSTQSSPPNRTLS